MESHCHKRVLLVGLEEPLDGRLVGACVHSPHLDLAVFGNDNDVAVARQPLVHPLLPFLAH